MHQNVVRSPNQIHNDSDLKMAKVFSLRPLRNIISSDKCQIARLLLQNQRKQLIAGKIYRALLEDNLLGFFYTGILNYLIFKIHVFYVFVFEYKKQFCEMDWSSAQKLDQLLNCKETYIYVNHIALFCCIQKQADLFS